MSNLIACETCGKEIAKKARVCPHCGAKRSTRGFMQTVLIVLIVFMALALIGAMMDPDVSIAGTPECNSSDGLMLAKQRFTECYSLNGGDEVKEILSPTQSNFNEQTLARNCTGRLTTSQGREYPARYTFSILNDGSLWTEIKIQTPSGTDYSTCTSN